MPFASLSSRIAAALLAAALAAPLAAQEPAAPAPGLRLFDAGILAAVPSDETIRFVHSRIAEPEDPRLPPLAGTAEMTLRDAETGGREAHLVLRTEAGERSPPPYPAEVGHPLFLIFLENTVRMMGEATGGNPDYIRRALRDTLWLGADATEGEIALGDETAPATLLRAVPFADDPNRGAMGPFADLALEVWLSDAVPGRFALLRSHLPASPETPALTETLAHEALSLD